MDLNQWFDKGISPDEYIESMNHHKENLLHIYDHYKLLDDDEFFSNITSKKLRVIVLTEDWCGDAMLNVPILLRVAEKANIDVRMLLRDQNLELMDKYLTNGKSRSIPIFIFIDQNGNEVAKWGPRAEPIQSIVDEARSKLPEKGSKDFDVKQKEMILFMNKAFRDNTELWSHVYNSIKTTLLK